MRISDWSSDVCSSDLRPGPAGRGGDTLRPGLCGGWRARSPRHVPCRGGRIAGALRRLLSGRVRLRDLHEGGEHGLPEDQPGLPVLHLPCKSEEPTSKLTSLMRLPYAVSFLKKQITYLKP